MMAKTLATTLSPRPCAPIAHALATVLGELRGVIAGFEHERYEAKMGPLFGNASIGGHVRHALDHARALADGAVSGEIDYDHRERGTPIEREPRAAMEELDDLIHSTRLLSARDAGERIGVMVMPTRDGESATLASTLGRELAFVLSHTIHHNATIRGMAVAGGSVMPDGFGYAPSTLAHAEQHAHLSTSTPKDVCACAR